MTTFVMMSSKGGAGKTTISLILASELANAGQTVTLLDADKNTPFQGWEERGRKRKCFPDNIRVVGDDNPATIQATIEAAQASSDHVIVDTEGTANRGANIAAQMADIVLIPTNPSILDISEARKAVLFISNLKRDHNTFIPYLIVPNRVTAVGMSKESITFLDHIVQRGHPVAKHRVKQLSAYCDMLAYGSSLYTIPKKTDAVAGARVNAAAFVEGVAESLRDQRLAYAQQQEEVA